jgi:hypothetical protein
MKERPIIMCAEMVRATLEDRKTQTRRTKGLEEINKNPDEWIFIGKNESYNRWYFTHRHKKENHIIHCPCGQVGDRLWVKETWALDNIQQHPLVFRRSTRQIQLRYIADGHKQSFIIYLDDYNKLTRNFRKQFLTRSSIVMPRWASRITLGITDERVERVQDINDFDAEKEGIKWDSNEDGRIKCEFPRNMFQDLWDSLNAKRGYGWGKNPWVWVIEFRRIKP